MHSAIGLIETKGLVGLVEATDAMAKAANVKVLKRVDIGGGLVTTVVSGDVGSVRAAVEFAAEPAEPDEPAEPAEPASATPFPPPPFHLLRWYDAQWYNRLMGEAITCTVWSVGIMKKQS